MENKIRDLEQQVNNLENKVKRLEKKESKRRIFNIIKLIFKLAIILVIVLFIYNSYIKINDKYINPIKESISKKNFDINDYLKKIFK